MPASAASLSSSVSVDVRLCLCKSVRASDLDVALLGERGVSLEFYSFVCRFVVNMRRIGRRAQAKGTEDGTRTHEERKKE